RDRVAPGPAGVLLAQQLALARPDGLEPGINRDDVGPPQATICRRAGLTHARPSPANGPAQNASRPEYCRFSRPTPAAAPSSARAQARSATAADSSSGVVAGAGS